MAFDDWSKNLHVAADAATIPEPKLNGTFSAHSAASR